jgi:hypothetical protein
VETEVGEEEVGLVLSGPVDVPEVSDRPLVVVVIDEVGPVVLLEPCPGGFELVVVVADGVVLC